MDDFYGILPPSQTDQLPALRAQRRDLLGLTADIRTAKSQLNALDPSQFWSSSAQRAYRGRVDEIVHDLQGVLDYLNDAQDQIWRSIRQLLAADEQ
ncbi:hypothetical protein [Cryobacterium sp. PH29-G1]|uniref:hypothetical protein n=1 Tax=Cryobacterium sp. PH29-G1 TaxID=3046211 RepID=UPI0024BACFAE|nr:hypothetical protein [Cryobacterium sp. PH29-G1]MDJ0348688.1 hypothetical protein [Cryobacterium sp. PH29-G1]